MWENIFTRYTLKKVRRKKYFCVIVDEASYLEGSILEKIYGINSKYFILVGSILEKIYGINSKYFILVG